MISKSIAKGTKVWHEIYGLGEFVCYLPDGLAVVQFHDVKCKLRRKDLTEIEDETK